MIIYKEKGNF